MEHKPNIPPRPNKNAPPTGIPIPPGLKNGGFSAKDSVEFMKQLAEFNSKKDELLRRIGSIGERMQKKLKSMEKSPPGSQHFTDDSDLVDEDDELNSVVNNELMDEDALENFSMHPENHYYPNQQMPNGGQQRPPILPQMSQMMHAHEQHPTEGSGARLVFTRMRETNKPAVTYGCLGVSFPSKKAIDDDWRELACKIGEYKIGKGFTEKDDGIILSPGGIMSVPTGIKLGIPDGVGIEFVSHPGISVIDPGIVTPLYRGIELVITIMNCTNDPIKIPYGEPLFMGNPVNLIPNVSAEELLNSTYDDWSQGTVN